jgi:general secretion pathway protein J
MHHGPSRGFTLVEVLVAMVIMSVIALMSWQGVDGIVRTRAASEQRLEQTLRLNTVLAQWEQDLNAIQESAQMPSFRFDGISMQLTRRTPEGLQLVVWSLRGGNLLRWAGPHVTDTVALKENLRTAQQMIGNEPQQLRTLTGLAQWQMYCFRGNTWSNCQSSAGTPDAGVGFTQFDPPPEGVRLVLSFAEGASFNGAVTRDVAVGP